MTTSLLIAIILAACSSSGAELLRCRVGWMPDVSRQLRWAFGMSTTIVLLNGLVAAPGQPGLPSTRAGWLLLVVGVLAYGVLWLSLLQIWRQFRWLHDHVRL